MATKKDPVRKKAGANSNRAKAPATPAQYVDALPPERRAVVGRLRQLIDKNIPKGFESTIGYGMLAWVVPHKLFPDGYHCDPSLPLPFLSLASQKQYVSLYHLGLYGGPLLDWLRREWPKHSAQRLDLGKCCLRLRKLDQIPWALLGELVTKMTPAQWIDVYQASRQGR